MKKRYLATIEEGVDAQMELAEIVGTVQKWKWTGVVSSIVMFAALFIILDDPAAKLLVGGSASVLYALWWLSNYRKQLRKNLRKMLVKALGSEDPIESEYELTESGVAFTQSGRGMTFSWDSVQSVESTSDTITIRMAQAGIVVIPTRIFDSEEECEQWLAFIESNRTAETAE